MASYDGLTTEQKNLLQAFTNFVRAWSGEQARANNHGAVANADYIAQIFTILGDLDAGQIIPNTSGLAGAASLVKEDLVSIVSHIQGILASYNTEPHRQLWIRATGAANMIG